MLPNQNISWSATTLSHGAAPSIRRETARHSAWERTSPGVEPALAGERRVAGDGATKILDSGARFWRTQSILSSGLPESTWFRPNMREQNKQINLRERPIPRPSVSASAAKWLIGGLSGSTFGPLNYESRGREFESLRAHHSVLSNELHCRLHEAFYGR